jgi:WhiB family redox-sensing transcriptional regulator
MMITKTEQDETWRDFAACRQVDMDLFFSEARGGARLRDEKDAKRTCRHCPVATECLEYSVQNCEPFGVWGGKTARERKKLMIVSGLIKMGSV